VNFNVFFNRQLIQPATHIELILGHWVVGALVA